MACSMRTPLRRPDYITTRSAGPFRWRGDMLRHLNDLPVLPERTVVIGASAFIGAVKAPLAILRPTLLYGAEDPHNGYGPNRFRRLANAGADITLFGEGEERRDHVLIDDLAEIVLRVLKRRSTGTLNIATGT